MMRLLTTKLARTLTLLVMAVQLIAPVRAVSSTDISPSSSFPVCSFSKTLPADAQATLSRLFAVLQGQGQDQNEPSGSGDPKSGEHCPFCVLAQTLLLLDRDLIYAPVSVTKRQSWPIPTGTPATAIRGPPLGQRGPPSLG